MQTVTTIGLDIAKSVFQVHWFTSRREQIAVLAADHKIPAIYHVRDFTAAGGLMSYAPDIHDFFVRRAFTPAASSRVRSPPSFQ